MQRFVLVFCLTALVATTPLFAEQMEDVVYLKNGSTIRGTIIEQILGESLKIQTRDGSVVTYAMDEIAKIAKEPVRKRKGGVGPEKVEIKPDAKPAGSKKDTDEAVKILKEPVMEAGRQIGSKKKEPWLACGLSLLIPGAGQFYNKQDRKGVSQLGAAIAGSGLVFMAVRDNYQRFPDRKWVDPDDDDRMALFGGLLWLGGLLWSVIDAPISANRINQQAQQSDYGHLLEFNVDGTTVGFDAVVQPDGSGARLALHF